MSDFVHATSSALGLAPIYILTATGFVIVYRATQVFNFAQGALMMLGAYFTYQATEKMGLALVPAIILTVLAMAVVGALIYQLTLRPLTGHGTFGLIIVTMGVSILLTGIVAAKWGFTALALSAPEPALGIHSGSFNLGGFDVGSIILTAVVLGALAAFFQYAPIGIQMRATAESPKLASQRGISVQRIYTITWMLAGAAAALAGAIVSFRTGASPTVAAIGLLAFPAALIGGFDSLRGAIVGGLIVALAQAYAAQIWGTEIQEAVVYALMLVVLMIRPYGLFGSPEVLRV